MTLDTAAIAARAAAATPGPWVKQARAIGGFGHKNWQIFSAHPDEDCGILIDGSAGFASSDYPEYEANAEFIAHARTDVPDLVRELEEKDKRIAALEGGDDAGAVLAMIADMLNNSECMHGKGHGESTPPMMYPEWIQCVVAKQA